MDVQSRLPLPGLLGLALLLTLTLSGCATTPTGAQPNPQDRWERANRGVYKFNDALDRAAIKPVAKGYKKITPNWMRQGVGNFFSNLEQPGIIVNELLQGKPHNAALATGRLMVNSVFGIGGLFDPASAGGIPKLDEDFGQTLGRWGVPSGPYVMLPFLGPSTARDAPSRIVDYFLEPLRYADIKPVEYYSLRAVELVDMRARLLGFDESISGAYDPYAFVRDSWLQRREYAVTDGDVPEENFDDMPADEAAPADNSGSKPTPVPQDQ